MAFSLVYTKRFVHDLHNITSHPYLGETIRVCGVEAAIVDAINEIQTKGDCETCLEAIQRLSFVDQDHLVSLLESAKTTKVTTGRVCAFLSLTQSPAMEWNSLLVRMENASQAAPDYWVSGKSGRTFQRWSIVVPTEILRWSKRRNALGWEDAIGNEVHQEEWSPVPYAEAQQPSWLQSIPSQPPTSVLASQLVKHFPRHSRNSQPFTFNPGQAELIQAALQGRDALGVLPTGSGKSLIYQFLAKELCGTVLVVSPLLSLMEDQVQQARSLGIIAERLWSKIEFEDSVRTRRLLQARELELLFITPEGLRSFVWDHRIDLETIKLLVVDEAHCISSWGPSFRPAYLEIGNHRVDFRGVPVLALTATATPRVQREIADNLRLRNPLRVAHSIVRNNLHLNATWVSNSLKHRLSHTRKVITAPVPGTPGIVYCRFQGLTSQVADDLSGHGIPTASFHAGLSDTRKAQTQNQFMGNHIQVTAATIALGMGLNKADIRLVIHSGFPSDLTSYVQEIGRAGRDGKVSACHLLYSKGDLMSQIMRPPSDDPKRDHIRIANARALWHFATTKMCRWQFLAKYFEEPTIPGKCGVCDNCLASTINSSKIAYISGRVVRRFHTLTHRPKSTIWARAWTIGLVYGRG